ncbi:MAG: type II secretion system protein GspM [Sandaracinaceae bacterium]
MIDRLRAAWDNLSDRERVGIGAIGGVALVLLIFLPVSMLQRTIASLERENAEITEALRRIESGRERLAAQRAEQAAAEARYATRAPSLGAFLEAQASDFEGVSISDLQPEPDREDGSFAIRHTRARMQNANLKDALLMLTEIKNSRYPVAIERIHIDHGRAGDQFNFQIGVLAYDAPEDDAPDAGVPADEADDDEDGPRRAGPPAPRR